MKNPKIVVTDNKTEYYLNLLTREAQEMGLYDASYTGRAKQTNFGINKEWWDG